MKAFTRVSSVIYASMTSCMQNVSDKNSMVGNSIFYMNVDCNSNSRYNSLRI